MKKFALQPRAGRAASQAVRFAQAKEVKTIEFLLATSVAAAVPSRRGVP